MRAMRAFSWQRVDGRAYRAATGRRLPSGSYVAEVLDQHAHAWCGWCHIVAVVQAVEDRAHVRHPTRPRVALDLQLVLDHFADDEMGDGWNPCHGGYPERVAECLRVGTCPLRRRDAPLVGYPRVANRTPVGNAPFAVRGAEFVTSDAVKEHLMRDGPVVLLINATTLKRVDRATGVVTDAELREPNHAVVVVGWTANAQWIVRNSWGRHRVPRDVPSSLDCVTYGRNACEVEWEYWSGDPRNPGYVYLPMSTPALQSPLTPWLVVHVE